MTEIEIRKMLDVLYDTRRQYNDSIKRVNTLASPLVIRSVKHDAEISSTANELQKFYNLSISGINDHIKSLESKLFELTKNRSNKVETAV